MKGKKREPVRRFAEEVKRDLVHQIDRGRLRVSEVSALYGVSRSAVYKWLRKYSVHWEKETRLIVEKRSRTSKVKELRERIDKLERALGRKQMRIDYLEKLIELSSKELGVDIEKKGAGRR